MATRFYLPTTEAAPIVPTQRGTWTTTTGFTTRKLRDTKNTSDTMAAGTTINLNATAGATALDVIFVSAQLNGAQSVSGTCKGELRVREFATTDNVDSIWFGAYVVSGDGATLRGTLLATGFYDAAVSEFANSATMAQRGIADGDTVTTVSAQDGDRIQIEIGFRTSVGGTTPQAAATYGQSEADLLDNGTATTGCGWWELSSVTLAFQAPPAAAAMAMLLE
jgi:hypothetical protein